MLSISPLLIVAAVAVAAAVAVPTPFVYSVTDCEQTGVHDNPAGNAAGNGHECVGGSGDNPEPVRSCSHKNSEKDNNEDNFAACIPRGHNTGDGD